MEVEGSEAGVFKRFEYPTMPFSVTGENELLEEVFEAAEQEGTSFGRELDKNEEARELVEEVYERMEENPAFSKELMDNLLADIYVDDNALAEMEVEDELGPKLGKFVAGWKHLADFYGIEGLVGGDAEEINPFLEDEGAMVAGGLDSLETVLPSMREHLSEEDWKETLVKISSLVERDYEQIDHGVDVLEHIHGMGDYDEEMIQDSRDTVDELVETRFENNSEFGKFYNTFIRFHNWMPLNITSDGPEGDAYDSICAPASEALEMIDGPIHESLSEIGDATSPKGLALAWLVQDQVEADGEVLGDREVLKQETREFEQRIEEELPGQRKDFEVFSYEDPAMYPGLVGGKWKGLKLLEDAREAFEMDYEMPDAEVVTSVGIRNLFEEERVDDLLKEDIFSMDENRREEVLNRIDSLDVERFTGNAPEDTIVRSSMYGEDGASNFAGTYESFRADGDVDEAFKNVVKSYFSKKAVQAREDKGLTHRGGIGVIIQENVEAEYGGVLHLTDEGYSISEAGDPEEAVEGNGQMETAGSIESLLEGTSVSEMSDDIEHLHSLFGDIDVEYVHDGEDVYLTQMRPKHEVSRDSREIDAADRYVLDSFDDMYDTEMENGDQYVVRMNFLGRENIMDKERDIEEFLRENQENIAAVEGRMPPPAHIPNNIEGHFRIPYRQIEEN